MKRTLRTLPALVLAVAVVLMSVAGSATAAKLITGKQIKNGTLTSADVRNGTLTGGDIKAGSVAGSDLRDGTVTGLDVFDGSLTGLDVLDGTLSGADLEDGSLDAADLGEASVSGKTVADGTIGADDLAPGLTTTATSLEAVAGVDVATCTSVLLFSCPSMMTVGLTPGTYLVTAAITMANDANAVTSVNDRCGLLTEDDNLHEVRYQLAPIGSPGHLASISLQYVITTGGGTKVQLKCTEMVGEDLVMVDANLAAVRVTGTP